MSIKAINTTILFHLYIQIVDNNIVTNQDDIYTWKQRDVTCRNILLATTESSQKQNLYGLQTAKQMWDTITAQYQTRAEEP